MYINVDIWRIIARQLDSNNNKIEFKFVYNKRTVVYKNLRGEWIDLDTKEKYVSDITLVDAMPGDLYIRTASMIPISRFIECKRNNMSKGKIKQLVKKHPRVSFLLQNR